MPEIATAPAGPRHADLSIAQDIDRRSRCGKGSIVLVSPDGTQAKVIPVYCKLWTCEVCGPRLRAKWGRAFAEAKPERFITLTCDTSKFADSHAAYQAMHDNFPRLVQMLRKRGFKFEYACVWEVTERGWPHLHVLQKGDFIPQKIIKSFWERRGVGSVVDIRKVYGAAGVARYVAKYLTDTAARLSFLPPKCRLISTSRDFLSPGPPEMLLDNQAGWKAFYSFTAAGDLFKMLLSHYQFKLDPDSPFDSLTLTRTAGPMTVDQVNDLEVAVKLGTPPIQRSSREEAKRRAARARDLNPPPVLAGDWLDRTDF